MSRLLATAVVIAMAIGCRAPTPSFHMFAPGATRVPPPATGSYGSADSYYQSPTITTPPVGSGVKASATRTGSTSIAAADASDTPQAEPAASKDVETASFESRGESERATNRVKAPASRVRIADAARPATAKRASTAGMPVNDLTEKKPVEPNPFRPRERMVEITQLPRSTATRSAPPRRVESSSRAEPAGGTTPAATRGAPVWSARESGERPLQVAGR